MFRLTILNFKNAIKSSETLFGLGTEVTAAIFYAWSVSVSMDGIVLGSVFCILPAIAGVFITFALTVDNEAGTVRNRIIAGYSRIKILLSQVFAAMLLSLVYILLSMIPVLILCHNTIGRGRTTTEVWYALVVIICCYFIGAVLGAVLATLLFSRGAAILLYIMIYVGLSFAAGSINIYENKYDRFHNIISYNFLSGDVTENPRYIPEPVRTILKPLFFASPLQQGIVYDFSSEADYKRRRTNINEDIEMLHADMEAYPDTYKPSEHYEEYLYDELRVCEEYERDLRLIPLYSGIIILVFVGVGAAVYRKENIC